VKKFDLKENIKFYEIRDIEIIPGLNKFLGINQKNKVKIFDKRRINRKFLRYLQKFLNEGKPIYISEIPDFSFDGFPEEYETTETVLALLDAAIKESKEFYVHFSNYMKILDSENLDNFVIELYNRNYTVAEYETADGTLHCYVNQKNLNDGLYRYVFID
jgi:hypothetical protein